MESGNEKRISLYLKIRKFCRVCSCLSVNRIRHLGLLQNRSSGVQMSTCIVNSWGRVGKQMFPIQLNESPLSLILPPACFFLFLGETKKKICFSYRNSGTPPPPRQGACEDCVWEHLSLKNPHLPQFPPLLLSGVTFTVIHTVSGLFKLSADSFPTCFLIASTHRLWTQL